MASVRENTAVLLIVYIYKFIDKKTFDVWNCPLYITGIFYIRTDMQYPYKYIHIGCEPGVSYFNLREILIFKLDDLNLCES